MTSGNHRSGTSRRRFITAAGAASVALAAPAIVRGQARKTAKVSVGRQPWAAGNSPVTKYMMDNKTFERFAGDAALAILLEAGVEDRVGDVIAHLVGVALGNRLGRERELRHWTPQ